VFSVTTATKSQRISGADTAELWTFTGGVRNELTAAGANIMGDGEFRF